MSDFFLLLECELGGNWPFSSFGCCRSIPYFELWKANFFFCEKQLLERNANWIKRTARVPTYILQRQTINLDEIFTFPWTSSLSFFISFFFSNYQITLNLRLYIFFYIWVSNIFFTSTVFTSTLSLILSSPFHPIFFFNLHRVKDWTTQNW